MVPVYKENPSFFEQAALIRNNVQKMVMTHDWALQLHGFYVSIAEKKMREAMTHQGYSSAQIDEAIANSIVQVPPPT